MTTVIFISSKFVMQDNLKKQASRNLTCRRQIVSREKCQIPTKFTWLRKATKIYFSENWWPVLWKLSLTQVLVFTEMQTFFVAVKWVILVFT